MTSQKSARGIFILFIKNEIIQRSCKTDVTAGKVYTIICASEFLFRYDDASNFFQSTMLNIFNAPTEFFSCFARNNIKNHSNLISQLFSTVRKDI